MIRDFDHLDSDLFCLRHGKPLLDGEYGFKASNCTDCEPDDVDGEAFRGGEAAAWLSEQLAAAQRLK